MGSTKLIVRYHSTYLVDIETKESVDLLSGYGKSEGWVSDVSRDGEKLAITYENEIYTLDLSNYDFRQITYFSYDADPPQSVSDPVWSPSGTRIAFLTSPDYHQKELRTMDANGKNARTIVVGFDSEWDGGMAWSPDETRIVFTVRGEHGNEIWVTNSRDGDMYKLSLEGEDCSFPNWLP